jgi:dolichyl-phosphate-mannose-protein mannosyltransferase
MQKSAADRKGDAVSTAHSENHSEVGNPPPAKIYLTAFVLGVAVLTSFAFRLNAPRSLFYDEVLYVDAAKAFLAGAPDTNPEIPPLGKYLIAAGIRLFGDNPYGWRAVSLCFGAGTVVAVFLWLYLLLHDYGLALAGALLAILNNFLYVMSRVAMMDIFLVGFLLWGLVAFTTVLDLDELPGTIRRILMAFAGTMFGLASACKWNGIDTLGIVGFIAVALLWLTRRPQASELLHYGQNLRQVGVFFGALSLVVVPVLAYSLTFWPMCRDAHHPFNLRNVVAMNVVMWKLHRADPGNVFIASKWYSWIFQVAPQRALSYLVGNWVIMWSGVVALVFCLRRIRHLPEAFVVLLYAGNLLQWAITPQKHLYYYYYFPCAVFTGAAIPIALYRLPRRIFGVPLSLVCVAAAAIAFLFCLQRMAYLDSPYDCVFSCWP